MNWKRWLYAAMGVLVLLFAGLIYAWSVLSRPVAAYFTDWSSAQLSLTFTICMMFFCLGGFFSGLLSGKINVKINMVISAFLFLAGFFLASKTSSLPGLYIGYGVLCGTASGIAYNSIMGTVTKYFPDKPGLISGILLMGFGFGSFLIGKVYQAYTGSGESFRKSFLLFGIILFIVMLLCALFIKKPDAAETAALIEKITEDSKSGDTTVTEDMNFRQMIRRSSFWLYFFWAILLCAAGLAVISQAGAMAVEVAPKASAGTISTVVGLISIFNGVGRVIFGGMYDRIGRGKTMVINEILFCSAIVLLILSLSTGSFLILTIGFIITGLAYGGVPTTNSAFVGSFYGKKHYSINFSVLNMNLFFASFGSTIAGLLYDSSGSYYSTLLFLLGAIVVGIVISMMIKKP